MTTKKTHFASLKYVAKDDSDKIEVFNMRAAEAPSEISYNGKEYFLDEVLEVKGSEFIPESKSLIFRDLRDEEWEKAVDKEVERLKTAIDTTPELSFAENFDDAHWAEQAHKLLEENNYCILTKF